MVCPTCSRENLADALFCAGCRAPLTFACSNCGRDLAPDASFCDRCGTPVSGDAANEAASSKETAALGHRTDHPTSFANGRYAVQKPLGEGGRKRVYQAHDSVLDRDIALAVIKTEGLDPTSRVRITREAQAMGRLGDHPHVLSIHDLGEDNGQPYMVLPLMPGGDVETLLEKAEDHRLPLEQAIDLAAQICRGLEFAHSKDIVHRDLKPGNVWLTADGTAKIGDFGLAVAIDRSRLTQEGMMVGTVSYMPPEQAMGGDVTPRSDLYSLGAMLYEMVTGRPPFLGDDSVAIIGQHINTPPVAPTWHSSECPKTLEALIMRLLAKDPSGRPESASDVLTALEAINLTAGTETTEQSADEAHVLDSLAGGVFVGRQREMGELKAALEDALSGRGRMVTLVGEPGIGKTRTSQELATYAGLRGCQVLWGRSYEEQGVPPYWPWVQAIRSYVRDAEPERLRSEMRAGAADIAEIVSDVRDMLPDIQPPPPLDSPEQARFRLFDSITAFLKTASQRKPIVLVLDDLHWSDKPSLMLLQFLTRELSGARLLLVGTYRDVELSRQHPLAETLAELTRERLFERVLLRGLTREDVGRFIEVTTGVVPPSGLVSTVHTQTEGNPLFVTEVVRLLAQEGELAPDKTGDRQSWTVRIPEGVREVIGRRLNRLTDRCNETLTVAAVVGREFELRQLSPLIEDVSEDMLLDVLEEGLGARVIEELPATLGRYQFTHALIQETLSEELSLTRRVRLHARIAETLEELYGADADARAAELAHHFAQAEALLGTEKLVRYSLVAGERALATNAWEEATSLFEQALAAREGQPMDADTAAMLFGLGGAQGAMGSMGGWMTGGTEAVSNMRRAFDFYFEAGDVVRAVAVAEHPHFRGPEGAGASQVGERALSLVEPDSHAAARLLCHYGITIYHETADYQKAQEAFSRAISIAQRDGDTALEAQTLANAAHVDSDELHWEEGLEKSLRAIELHPQVDDTTAGLMGRRSAAEAFRAIGDFEGARVHVEAAMASAERLRIPQRVGQALASAMLEAYRDADWQAARNLCDRGLAVAPLSPLLLGFRAWLEYEVGDFSQGEAYLERLLETMRQAPPGPNLAYSIPCLVIPAVCRIAGTTDRLQVAEEVAKVVLSSPFGVPRYVMSAPTGLALIAVQRRDAEAAAEHYPALESVRGTLLHADLATMDRRMGLLAQTMGNLDRAIVHFEDALAFCRKTNYRPELAWTCCDYADLLRERDEEGDRQKATTLLDESLAISSELGMRPLMERVLSRKMSLQGIDVSSPLTSIDAVVSAVEVERPNLRPHAAPDGTVTVMFTDIEGSTAMTERLGDQKAQDVLRIHNAIIRQKVATHQGFEVKSQGDGFMVAFSSARRALECAIAIQQNFAIHEEAHPGEPIRVRIGLHTGEAIKEGEDFFGKSVILAARIASQAMGGEILVSSLLKALVESSREFEFGDEQDVELKGLSGTHKVFLVGWYDAGVEDRHNEE